jgi:hypothetical protein
MLSVFLLRYLGGLSATVNDQLFISKLSDDKTGRQADIERIESKFNKLSAWQTIVTVTILLLLCD